METVRLGIVGLGNMGKAHLANIRAGKVPGMRVTAMCESVGTLPAQLEGEQPFTDVSAMIKSGHIDAILICTPHFSHTTIGIEALQNGLHVLVEKPISVHKADCERLIAAHTDKSKIFAAMFNMRTNACFKKVKDLIDSGELGEIRRVHWEVTNWFRTNYYYATGGWRGTWKGEGGGVLMNQCPHNLDLFQWMFGVPKTVRGFCQFGRFHEIEVEDNVTAVLQYENGTTATFITSTGEAPGINRLEISAEMGRLTVTDGSKIHFQRNRVPMSKFCMEAEAAFAMPESWHMEIPVADSGGQHVEILQNFANAILKGEKLLSPAEQGIHSVELANAILLSTWQDKAIELPMSAADYERILIEKGEKSTFEKTKVVAKASADDFAKSFR
ncbi:Gfo/Idh/MocA family oxidoreductase [Prosthecobacter sp. SYSU 5D2]|uniref:Gfo/Idh/MocA family protein n=1 Tax=Prosthecobacter sp. SYSU 5D2 TaxID=3134134 RepID=UPI0031FEC96F